MHGEVYSVPKQAGVRTKQIRERLGDAEGLPSIDQAKDAMAQDMSQTLGRLYNEQASQAQAIKERFEREKTRIVEEQRKVREQLAAQQQKLQLQEQAARQERFRRGILGLWDRITGEHKRIAEQNRLETLAVQQRDQRLRDRTIFEQLEQRHAPKMEAHSQHNEAKRQADELKADKERFLAMRKEQSEERERQRQRGLEERRKDARSRARGRGGPSLDR